MKHLPAPIGSYVKYRNVPMMIVDFDERTFKILDPSTNKKLSVSSINSELHPLDCEAAMGVEYKGKEYIVTRKGLIISRVTNRVMKWGKENGDRIAILESVTYKL